MLCCSGEDFRFWPSRVPLENLKIVLSFLLPLTCAASSYRRSFFWCCTWGESSPSFLFRSLKVLALLSSVLRGFPENSVVDFKMSETYDSYERQYFELSDKVSRKCVSAASASGEEKKQMLVEIKTGLDEAESLIRRMDLEARNLPPTQKATLLAGLRSHKTDLNNLKKEVKKTAVAKDTSAARDELMEGGMASSDLAVDQRGRLLMSTERLNQTGDRIKESKRTLLETESLGVSILADLHSQRQTLLHARDTMHDVDDNIGKSRRVLTSMTRLMNRNKIIGWGIIVVLVFIICVFLYIKFK